ncbi:MAG: response regulator [Bacteroidales bacterium]|nr:response regulator [Bacteroidales bacterium]
MYKCLREIHGLNQAELQEKTRSGILLTLNTPGSLEHFMVHTDPDKLKYIFDTLMNHVLYFHDNGSIEFGYKLGRDDQLSFYVKEPPRTGSNQVSFENELQTEAELLSEIREILADLGGSIRIDNNPEFGKTFWFTLEIMPPENKSNEEMKKPGVFHQPDWSGKTILIVDDVYTNRLLLESSLISTKARVVSVANGLKAVNAVKKDELIDFVLMDVRMPVLDGYEATRRIKRIKPWLPVVAISAYPDSAETVKWKRAGCDAFLGKPLNTIELIKTMNALFRNE